MCYLSSPPPRTPSTRVRTRGEKRRVESEAISPPLCKRSSTRWISSLRRGQRTRRRQEDLPSDDRERCTSVETVTRNRLLLDTIFRPHSTPSRREGKPSCSESIWEPPSRRLGGGVVLPTFWCRGRVCTCSLLWRRRERILNPSPLFSTLSWRTFLSQRPPFSPTRSLPLFFSKTRQKKRGREWDSRSGSPCGTTLRVASHP